MNGGAGQGAGQPITPPPFSIDIAGGRVTYRNESTDWGMAVKNIQAHMAADGKFAAEGSFTAEGHNFAFALDAPAPSAESPMPLNVKLDSGDRNTLQWQGTIDLSADMPKPCGKART